MLYCRCVTKLDRTSLDPTGKFGIVLLGLLLRSESVTPEHAPLEVTFDDLKNDESIKSRAKVFLDESKSARQELLSGLYSPKPIQPFPTSSSQTGVKRIKIVKEDWPLIEALLTSCCNQLVAEGLLLKRDVQDAERTGKTTIYTLVSIGRVIRPALLTQLEASQTNTDNVDVAEVIHEVAKKMPTVPRWRLARVMDGIGAQSKS
jgi:hypothetical protein